MPPESDRSYESFKKQHGENFRLHSASQLRKTIKPVLIKDKNKHKDPQIASTSSAVGNSSEPVSTTCSSKEQDRKSDSIGRRTTAESPSQKESLVNLLHLIAELTTTISVSDDLLYIRKIILKCNEISVQILKLIQDLQDFGDTP